MTRLPPPPPSGRDQAGAPGGEGREPLATAIAGARRERRGGISIQTLVVASAASAVASFAASHVWGSGTVLSAALTPVLVALVSEFLHRPVDRVSAGRGRATGSSPVAGTPPREQDWAPVNYGPRRLPWWRTALLTGVLAFGIVVGFYTIPDLVLGHSITGTCGASSLFSSCPSRPAAPAPTPAPVVTVTSPAPATPPAAAPQPAPTGPTQPSTDRAPQQTGPTGPGTAIPPNGPSGPTATTPAGPTSGGG